MTAQCDPMMSTHYLAHSQAVAALTSYLSAADVDGDEPWFDLDSAKALDPIDVPLIDHAESYLEGTGRLIRHPENPRYVRPRPDPDDMLPLSAFDPDDVDARPLVRTAPPPAGALDELVAQLDRAAATAAYVGADSAMLLSHAADLIANAVQPRPAEEWREAFGPVLWWRAPITEPPYVGTPLDSDWPEGLTHWSPILVPMQLA